MTTYKQCEIVISRWRHDDNLKLMYHVRGRDSLKPLYHVRGRYVKHATWRPFLTSEREAQEWINEQIAADDALADDRVA